jgi:hypothetical protein
LGSSGGGGGKALRAGFFRGGKKSLSGAKNEMAGAKDIVGFPWSAWTFADETKIGVCAAKCCQVFESGV